jgi:hypothetical protein
MTHCSEYDDKYVKGFTMKKYLLTLGCLFFLVGCGGTSFVTGASLSSSSSNGDQFADLTVDLNSAGLLLPTLTLPILDLKDPSRPYGDITIGSSALEISVDLSALAGLPQGSSSALLPNGTSIPITGYDASTLLTFSLGGNSLAYIDLNTSTGEAFFGAAIVISEFNIGVPVNLFIPFSSNGVTGTAGVFTGAAAGESGFAVFANVSSLLGGSSVAPILKEQVKVARVVALPEKLEFGSATPSYENMNRLNSMLNHLKRDRVQLHLE